MIPCERNQSIAPAVILATGGFGASKQLLKRYRPDLLAYKTTNQVGATGDGIILAEHIGAQVLQMEMIQIHPSSIIQDHLDALHLGTFLDKIQQSYPRYLRATEYLFQLHSSLKMLAWCCLQL